MPEHRIEIFRDFFGRYSVHCYVCGNLGTYKTLIRAQARVDTHEREQDAGSD